MAFGSLYLEGDWSWRMWCCMFQIIIPTLILCLLPFVPESPRWLISKGRGEDAHNILAKYHTKEVKDDELGLFELQEIIEALGHERTSAKTSWTDLFATRDKRWRMAIIFVVGWSSQWVGNGVISYYPTSILNSVGITNPTQQTSYKGGLQVSNWIMAVFGALVCERYGRRKMWLISAIGMFFSYIVIAACSAGPPRRWNGCSGVPLCLFRHLRCWSECPRKFTVPDSTVYPLTMSYPLEILSFRLRTKGMVLLMLMLWLSLTFNIYVSPMAWQYYFVFASVSRRD